MFKDVIVYCFVMTMVIASPISVKRYESSIDTYSVSLHLLEMLGA